MLKSVNAHPAAQDANRVEVKSRKGVPMGPILGALGVVYGDIGTSPLYALRESFHRSHLTINPINVLGVLSLVFWALIIVITIKYLVLILRADNRGEGGILALLSLITTREPHTRKLWLLILLSLFGTALLYGDGIITPAISVLSAVEGLAMVTPVFQPYIEPITVAILIALFAAQSRGTAVVGRVFGPIMLLWFATIGALGARSVIANPDIMAAINPVHAVEFFLNNGWHGYFVLGSVFLVVTGGEALYADMGHFGQRPIRAAWFGVVLPALLLNYFGQGALLLSHMAGVEHPFFSLAPGWGILPLVVLATLATVIASQALISGAFSLTMQAVQLGYAPRVAIEHTSAQERGQIYVPVVNWGLMIACVGLVLGFGSSSKLAAAYGVGVTTVMLITTMLFFVVIHKRWQWNLVLSVVVAGVFLLVDLAFWGANIVKVPHGGWFPLVVGAILFMLFTTWHTGRSILAKRMKTLSLPLRELLPTLERFKPVRVPGTAVFMYRNLNAVPPAMLQNLRHNKVFHEHNVILCVETADAPRVPEADRIKTEKAKHGLDTVILTYGFMEEPEVVQTLQGAYTRKMISFDPGAATYFIGRENLIATDLPGMAIWREKLFVWMARNAHSVPMFFHIPTDRVIEIGTQVQI
jgi:KUP system potassium uptake protein